MIDRFFGDAFEIDRFFLLISMIDRFFLPILEYCSAVWCSSADIHLKLLDLIVTGGCFLT